MIDILLSTYNGEQYLVEQLESLFQQSYKDWNLLIRDDGSTDNTIVLLNAYQIKHPDKIILFIDKKNVGVVKSFEYLMTKSNAAYIMFCDQDDRWLPNKIELTLREMKKMESKYQDFALLVHTDLKVVNERFQTINESFWSFSKLDQELLSNFNYLGVCNGATGCTIMINKYAKDICLPFSRNTIMHDSWVALNIAKFGMIGYLSQSTILYRQHELNHVGAKEVKGLNYLFSKTKNIRKIIENNRIQRKILIELGYGSFIKYLLYKIIYFIRARL